jgi:hypothetical protein
MEERDTHTRIHIHTYRHTYIHTDRFGDVRLEDLHLGQFFVPVGGCVCVCV